jgi:hypothetical protein
MKLIDDFGNMQAQYSVIYQEGIQQSEYSLDILWVGLTVVCFPQDSKGFNASSILQNVLQLSLV